MVDGNGSPIIASSFPRESSQTPPSKSGIAENASFTHPAPHQSSKISPVFIDPMEGPSNPGHFRTSSSVRDPCSEHIEDSAISSDDVRTSEEEQCIDSYESSVSSGEHNPARYLNGKAPQTLKRKKPSIVKKTANSASKIPSEIPDRQELPIQSLSTSDSRRLPDRHNKWDLSPADVDNKIMKLIRQPHNSNRYGDVYVLKQECLQPDPLDYKSNLLKIGGATNIYKRKEQLRGQYHVDLVDVEDDRSEYVHMKHFERAELLAQTELCNFRYKYPWLDKKRGPNGYTEWFHIDTKTAVRVVQRWRNFLLKDPYDKHGNLKDYWKQRLDEVPHPGPEKYDDHESRHRRWDRFVYDAKGDEKTDQSTENPPTDDNKSSGGPRKSTANTTPTSGDEEDTTSVEDSDQAWIDQDTSISVTEAQNPKLLNQTSSGVEGFPDMCQNFAARGWCPFCTVQFFLWLITRLRIWPYFEWIVACVWLAFLYVALLPRLRTLRTKGLEYGFAKAAMARTEDPTPPASAIGVPMLDH